MNLLERTSARLRNKRSARQWNRNSRIRWSNWWDSEFLRHYVNEQICDLPGREDGIAAALRNHVGDRRLARGLSIGFGDAKKELALLQSGLVKAFDLYEISPKQIAAARTAFASVGMAGHANFLTQNPLSAPSAPLYDLIYWDHSLHHMLDVPATLRWCKTALAPNGVICINDYVGPTRLQWTAQEAKAANAFLTSFDKKYGIAIPKVSKGNPLKRLRLFLKDPSEAPQSDLIESACADIFPGFRLRPLGGAMLNMCGGMVMGLEAIPEGLLEDFANADRECAGAGIYHFAFGIWQRGPAADGIEGARSVA
jgi:SAM-dependent methyltransferase